MTAGVTSSQHQFNRKQFLQVSGLSALALAGVAGCGSSGSGTAGASRHLNVAISGGPDTLDPHTTIAGTDWIALANIYDGLFMRDYASSALPARTIPGLATSYAVSPDGRTYTFKLRQGVTFHDGAPWNADAAVFNFRRWFDKSFPYYSAQANSTVSPFIGGVADMKAVDASTFRVQLERANAGWFDYLAGAPTFFMVSPQAVKQGAAGLANHGVGTGPYIVKEYTRNVRLVLAANPKYWGGKPPIDELVIAPVPDDSARVSGLLSGTYDIAQEIPPDSINVIRGNPDFNLRFAGKPVTFGFAGDMRRGPWSDARVREAVSLAINRQGIVNSILHGAGVPASQFYGLGNPAHDPSLKPLQQNVARAKELLASAGLSKGLHLSFSTSTAAMGVPDPPRILEQIQSDLLAVGVTSDIKVSEWTAYLGFWAKGVPPSSGDTVPVYTQAMGWDTNMLLESYAASASQPPGGVNFAWYSNPQVDAKLASALKTTSQDGLIADLRAAQVAMMADQPYVFVFHGRSPFAVRKSVAWVPANAWAQRFSRARAA